MTQKNFEAFKETIEETFMRHPVVTSNAYTGWFAKGDMSLLEDLVGVSNHWIVFGFLTLAVTSLLLMQGLIRAIRRVRDT